MLKHFVIHPHSAVFSRWPDFGNIFPILFIWQSICWNYWKLSTARRKLFYSTEKSVKVSNMQTLQCIMTKYITQGEERETNKMQLIWCLLSNFYLNMFLESLCPSSGECLWCLCTGKVTVRLSRTVTFTVHTARIPAPQNHSHHNQCRTPHAAVHTLVLLMMGIMIPEPCWDKVW